MPGTLQQEWPFLCPHFRKTPGKKRRVGKYDIYTYTFLFFLYVWVLLVSFKQSRVGVRRYPACPKCSLQNTWSSTRKIEIDLKDHLSILRFAIYLADLCGEKLQQNTVTGKRIFNRSHIIHILQKYSTLN